MEQVIQITALCVVGAVLALVVKKGSPEAALLLTLAAAVTVLLFLGGAVEELMAFLDELAQEAPLERNGTPEDVAKVVESLADAEFVTGQVLGVSGGLVM